MTARSLTTTAAIAVVGLALLVVLGASVFGSPPSSPPPATQAPVAQVSPRPSAPVGTAEPTAAPSPPPSPQPLHAPAPRPVALPYEPPDCEVYKVLYWECIGEVSAQPGEAGEPGEATPEPISDGELGLDLGPVPAPVKPGSSGAVASRVVIPTRNIDLPVVSGELRVSGNRNNYPLCDVAQYLTYFVQPGEEGTAYVYSHAQRGMFLPLLRASRRDSGSEMVGARVYVYTTDARVWVYEIFRVKRHSTNLNIGYNVKAGEQQLVLQTSEGPPGHRPVLQIAARPIGVAETTRARAMPAAKPRVCLPPRR